MFQGHAFDQARSGYVNLHQTARRGDTRTMLMARRSFLERGFFQRISDAINARVVCHLKHLWATRRLRGDEVIVDVGCGEGYYLRRLAEHLQRDGAFSDVGVDASKDAARLTASGLRSHACAVVDIAHSLDLRRGSAAVLLNVFAPRNPRAFAETLMPGGLCLVIVPRPEHLKELRDVLPLLQIPAAKQTKVEQQFRPHLTAMEFQDLTYGMRLDAEAIRTWVQMGPNAWHLSPDRVSALSAPGVIATQVACTLMSCGPDCSKRGMTKRRAREPFATNRGNSLRPPTRRLSPSPGLATSPPSARRVAASNHRRPEFSRRRTGWRCEESVASLATGVMSTGASQ